MMSARFDSNLAMPNDENAVYNMPTPAASTIGAGGAAVKASAGSKTPAATKTRRAFGDISNRKKAASALQQQPTAGKLAAAASAQIAPFKQNTKRRVDFTLPQKETNKPKAKSIQTAVTKSSTTKAPVVLLEPVDDIELPAGRLWSQQQALDDAFDCANVISVEGVTTMAQDLDALLKQRLDSRVRRQEKETHRYLTERDPAIDALFAKDGTCRDTECNSLIVLHVSLCAM